MTKPTPRMPLPWIENTERETADGPPCLVGDRFLIAVPLSRGGYEYSVIVADEVGWTDPDGESWSAWAWSSVSHYIPLDGQRTKEELEDCE